MRQEISTDTQRDQFIAAGVTVVRDVLDQNWLAKLAAAVDANMAAPGPCGKNHAEDGGAYFGDYVNWQRFPDFLNITKEGPLGQLSAELMEARQVQQYGA